VLAAMTCCLFACFCITCHFDNFARFYPEVEARCSSEMLIPGYQAAWFHDPEDHNIYVCETPLHCLVVLHLVCGAYKLKCKG
jgi:hypothetical protein